MNYIQNSIPHETLQKHGEVRETFKWDTFGKRHDKRTPKTVVLKNIGDSHLMHLYGFLKLNKEDQSTIDIIETEILYRTQFYIFVKDIEE